MNFLEIKGLKKSFGQGESHIDVLKGIDMTINQGEFCVLLGPSGSGKSTLLNIIGGIDSLDEVLNRKLYPSDDCKLYYPI